MTTSLDFVSPRRSNQDQPSDWRRFLVAQPEVTSLTVREAAHLWLKYESARGRRSMRDARSAVPKHVVGNFGDLDCRDLAPEHVVAWIECQLADGYANRSVRRHVSYLSSTLEHAKRVGAVERNVCRLLPRGSLPAPKARDPHKTAFEVLSAGQLELMTSQPPVYRRVLWALCLLAGLRFGEAAALRWGKLSPRMPLGELLVDESWDCRARTFNTTKTDEVRHVPVHPRLARVLRSVRAWWTNTYRRAPEAGDLVAPFQHQHRDLEQPQPWHEGSALRWWRHDLRACGIPRPAAGPRKLHSARHTFSSLLARAGVARNVRESMTHTEQRTTAADEYVHLDWLTVCAAVVKLGVEA